MQRSATKLQTVEQLPLIGSVKPASRPVSLDRIYTLTDTHEALQYGCELGRLAPKQIYGDMGIDKTTWSRICGGEFDLDGRDIHRFDRVVGNDAYLLYLNHIHGYDLTSLRKTESDEVAALRVENEALKSENFGLRTSLKHVLEAKGQG
jgi:hypothetical protein